MIYEVEREEETGMGIRDGGLRRSERRIAMLRLTGVTKGITQMKFMMRVFDTALWQQMRDETLSMSRRVGIRAMEIPLRKTQN